MLIYLDYFILILIFVLNKIIIYFEYNLRKKLVIYNPYNRKKNQSDKRYKQKKYKKKKCFL